MNTFTMSELIALGYTLVNLKHWYRVNNDLATIELLPNNQYCISVYGKEKDNYYHSHNIYTNEDPLSYLQNNGYLIVS